MLFVAGCGSKPRVLSPDPRFSLNLIEVPQDWPIEKKDWPADPMLASAQQRIYEENGKPDFFQVMWKRDGRLMRTQEFEREMLSRNEHDQKAFLKSRSLADQFRWIYVDKKLVYNFKKKTPEKIDLTDDLKTVTIYGDPEDIKESTDANGDKMLIFTYFSEGKIYYYRNGKQYKEDDVTPVPGMGIRR